MDLNQVLENTVEQKWAPVETSSEEALAKEISSNTFQKSLSDMLDKFDTLIPKEEDISGRKFISMAQKNKLIEEFFPFGSLSFRSQFISLTEKSEICYMTIYVLTDDGYLPWFSRLGMSDPNTSSTDGTAADAETSAKRRIFIALGLGYESGQEQHEMIVSQTEKALEEGIINHGMAIFELVSEYQERAHMFNLPKKLSGDYPSNQKDAEKMKFNISDVSSEDGVLLLKYLKEKQGE